MRFTEAEYIIEDIQSHENLLNELFLGLKKFKDTNNDFDFIIKSKGNIIEVKTIKMNESVN